MERDWLQVLNATFLCPTLLGVSFPKAKLKDVTMPARPTSAALHRSAQRFTFPREKHTPASHVAPCSLFPSSTSTACKRAEAILVLCTANFRKCVLPRLFAYRPSLGGGPKHVLGGKDSLKSGTWSFLLISKVVPLWQRLVSCTVGTI